MPLSADALAILENIGDAYYALDGAWRIVYANRRALEFWNLPGEAVIGQVIWESLPQLLGTLTETVLRRVRAQQQAVSFEAPSPITGNWVHVSVTPFGDGVGVYWRDITERIRTQQTLRDSEEHLRLAQEAAGIATWEVDLVTHRTRWSPGMFRLLGLDPDALPTGEHFALWRRSVHPDDRDMVAEAARRYGRVLTPFTIEFRIVRPDGEVRWINALGKALPDANGKPRRMLGVNIDITARKHAEVALEERVADRTRALGATVEELRRTRERYEAIFAHSPIYLAFMRVEPDGRVVCEDINDAWVRDTGIPREQVVGRSLDEIFPPEQAAFGIAKYRMFVETREPIEYEYSHVFPAGEVVRRTYLVPLLDDDGRVHRVLLTSVDLTAMRAVEAQLRQAQKMEAIGQLTGGIAHDFNNLLTVVLGHLELLRTRLHEQASLNHVDAARHAALRGGQLTQQLLAYARRQTISPCAVDLAAMIGGMGDLLRRSLGGLVQIEIALEPDLWPAHCDPTQLELMLLNLAINARDAMPSGGVIVIAACNVLRGAILPPELKSGDYVAISVIDTGSGMPPDVQERAFEPFFTTKEPGKGSGLGLAQVWGLAQQFGGTVLLESAPGRGTTVHVFLPRADAGVPETAQAGATIEDSFGTGNILVVDDDPDAGDVAAAFLEDAGYSARCVGGGPAALARLDSDNVSLVLVDYAMPEMSGAEFVRRARQRQPDLPAVFVTGNADALRADPAVGNAPVLGKPYTRAGLIEAVQRALQTPLS